MTRTGWVSTLHVMTSGVNAWRGSIVVNLGKGRHFDSISSLIQLTESVLDLLHNRRKKCGRDDPLYIMQIDNYFAGKQG
jgi:hypothetical protein